MPCTASRGLQQATVTGSVPAGHIQGRRVVKHIRLGWTLAVLCAWIRDCFWLSRTATYGSTIMFSLVVRRCGCINVLERGLSYDPDMFLMCAPITVLGSFFCIESSTTMRSASGK